MTVSLTSSRKEKTLKDFVRCLPVLQNLHTLEITCMRADSRLLGAGLKSTLPQIRTVILPSTAHYILRHCPNIEDLTCSPGGPNREFFESLAIGKPKLRRFATLFPGDIDGWTSKCSAHMVTLFFEAPSTRTGEDLPPNQGNILHACKVSP